MEPIVPIIFQCKTTTCFAYKQINKHLGTFPLSLIMSCWCWSYFTNFHWCAMEPTVAHRCVFLLLCLMCCRDVLWRFFQVGALVCMLSSREGLLLNLKSFTTLWFFTHQKGYPYYFLTWLVKTIFLLDCGLALKEM